MLRCWRCIRALLEMVQYMVSGIATAVDGGVGSDANSVAGWWKCANWQNTSSSPHWPAVDLKKVFLISKISVSFRHRTGYKAVFVIGNNPSVTNCHDDSMCGDRWTQNVRRAPHFHEFTCRPPKWASHDSVQRIIGHYIQICEVKVYYIMSPQVYMF
jgi:hypothetical protein